MEPSWDEALDLLAGLHAAQVNEDEVTMLAPPVSDDGEVRKQPDTMDLFDGARRHCMHSITSMLLVSLTSFAQVRGRLALKLAGGEMMEAHVLLQQLLPLTGPISL